MQLFIFINTITMHFVIADNNGTQILNASDANKYITDITEQLYKE